MYRRTHAEDIEVGDRQQSEAVGEVGRDTEEVALDVLAILVTLR